MKKFLFVIVMLVGMVSSVNAQDVNASFPGGEKAQAEFISKTMVYPASAKENGVEGKVVVSFVVKTDGTIGNIKIKRMVDPDLEAEAIRIVKKMPKWNPAVKDGKVVESIVDFPFNFKL